MEYGKSTVIVVEYGKSTVIAVEYGKSTSRCRMQSYFLCLSSNFSNIHNAYGLVH